MIRATLLELQTQTATLSVARRTTCSNLLHQTIMAVRRTRRWIKGPRLTCEQTCLARLLARLARPGSFPERGRLK